MINFQREHCERPVSIAIGHLIFLLFPLPRTGDIHSPQFSPLSLNITCLLALASVYMGVSTSQSVKPVEYFLIYNLVYPFLTILLAVYIQVRLSDSFVQ